MQPIDQIRAMLKGLIGSPDTPFMVRREATAAFADAFEIPPEIRIETGMLERVPVEWVTPDNAKPGRVVFHLHGGGYVLGNPAASRPLTTELARQSGARVVSVDYRLAPEHPFPAAVEDAVSAYRGLLATGQPAEDIAIGGESAGGGLAVATLLAARDEGLRQPAALFAISPWTDLRCLERMTVREPVDPMLTRRALGEMADAYLAGGSPATPLASPALADLAALPPMLIHVGSDEVLLDDARDLWRKAVACGVDAKIDEWDGMIHVWHMFHALLPEGRHAIARIAAFVENHWAGAS